MAKMAPNCLENSLVPLTLGVHPLLSRCPFGHTCFSLDSNDMLVSSLCGSILVSPFGRLLALHHTRTGVCGWSVYMPVKWPLLVGSWPL